MKQRTTKNMNAKIYSSDNGEYLGTVKGFDDARYVNACENPDGRVRAGDVIDDADLKTIGLTGDEMVYALTQ